ncbi:polysaccharide lyase family 8 super-sandwich domain-containing protein [Cohnella sp. GCM10012308]|uniref:polysaccharide lyase family 8 super-sandwich domain-containing protein n=1 Tax=Cohnella sp. GCM10012308 TaxID=3317329 RepID=UPI0036079EA6
MKKRRTWLGLLLAISVIASLWQVPGQQAHAAGEYDTLRAKWKEMLTGGTSYNPSDSEIAPKIASIQSEAAADMTAMDVSPTRTRLWAFNGATSGEIAKLSYRKLKEMALGYATKGTSMEGDPGYRDAIVSAMEWMYAQRYNETIAEAGNWWDWDIGAPIELTNIVILMYDDFTSAQRTNYMNAIEHFASASLYAYSGANRVWLSYLMAMRGMILEDGGRIAAGRDGLGDVFEYVTSGDGFYRDGSFVQHTKFAYTGGYGKDMLKDIANLMYVLSGSSWAVTDSRKDNLFKWVYDGVEPLLYKGAMMDMSRGREISRNKFPDHVVGHDVIQTLIRISQFAPLADRLAIRSLVKYEIGADTYRSFYDDASINMILLARQIMNDAAVSARGELSLNHVFAGMDRIVHQQPGFGFAVSMSSKRILPYELLNGENRKAWHTGEGMTYLYNGDLGQFSEDFWPTVDPYRLPGTTAQAGTQTQTASGQGGDVAGGASLGGYGVAAMRLTPYAQTLDAKKSWFMFDDEVVALGAGISASDGKVVETTVENRKLDAAGDNAFTVNGTAKSNALGWSETMTGVNWAHLDGNVSGSGIGYYFPTPATLKASRKANTGAWNALNTYVGFNDATPITRNYLNLWFDHGTNPTAGDYAYVLLPNRTASQVSAYATSPDIAVLENSQDAQGVQEAGLGVKAVQFWKDQSKTVSGITSDKVASVVVKETASEIAIAVADPSQLNTGTIQIGLSAPAACTIESDPGIVVQQTSPGIQFTVNVNGSEGQSFVVSFKKSGTCGGTQLTTYESESLSFDSSGDVSQIVNGDAAASGGKWRKYASNAVGDYAEHALNVPQAGTYNVSVRGKLSTDRATAQLTVQGIAVGAPVDFYKSGTASFQTIPVGTMSFASGGPKTFRFTVTGKNGASTDYVLPLDAIILERTGPVPAVSRQEAELLTSSSSAGDTVVAVNDGGASGGKMSKLNANAANDYVSYAVNVAAPGTYRIYVKTKNYTDRGIFQLYVDGAAQGTPVNEYASGQTFQTYNLGTINFSSAGSRTFKFQVTGTSGTGYVLVFDRLDLVPE